MADMIRRRYRSVFISDVHLGARACRAEALLAFLDGLECDRLYLLGDIVDGWRLQRRWFWPAAHAAVIDRLFALARQGVALTYVPGNHDAFARDYCGFEQGGIAVAREAAYVAADGRRYLLAHGDAYDPGAQDGAAARVVGDLAYRILMRLDGAARSGRRMLGLADASLAAWAKRRSVLARRAVEGFESALAAEALRQGFDGIICGHIHSAAARNIDSIAYVNCGDWVESCSAAVETFDGRLDVLHWRPEARLRRRLATSPMAAPAWSA